ncbi:glutathione S-transferase [Vibrio sp. qd031]|uniref:glutathione S-transferase n=1 Tax=Vibrio sp. qd031 TaxID=1603038 RepID=UPI000A10CAAB|nr:glutathione S-transferase [Vibrio sp. qd031]ORT51086.1 glutathione S-transferase [Vibrio sp. qd031]
MTPILYSLQNCPYAMRARYAIFKSRTSVLIRAIKLNNKPDELLQASAKGTVPVLVIHDGAPEIGTEVIDESLEIMLWALSSNDPDNLLMSNNSTALPKMLAFIAEIESQFIPLSNAFSCAKRYHEDNMLERREACEHYLQALEQRLRLNRYLFSDQETLADIAIMPFIRKFARIDKQWFKHSSLTSLDAWLQRYLTSAEFSKVMKNYPLWLPERRDVYFGS